MTKICKSSRFPMLFVSLIARVIRQAGGRSRLFASSSHESPIRCVDARSVLVQAVVRAAGGARRLALVEVRRRRPALTLTACKRQYANFVPFTEIPSQLNNVDSVVKLLIAGILLLPY
ncbi:hypothetical protein EVAR_75060_1 [Eumeta japonica]|uniref:Uncharacterized protein n=1 Tax=Eumeta variegata TaxID=151549 RepID=A0A4C1W0L4_EUMVA|nr:hypothetical protein EVAR_75060_1 [Eumeta japonica]